MEHNGKNKVFNVIFFLIERWRANLANKNVEKHTKELNENVKYGFVPYVWSWDGDLF